MFGAPASPSRPTCRAPRSAPGSRPRSPAVEPKLHILVNNAGATWGAPLADYPADAFDKVLDLNVKAPFLLTQALLPLIEAAATADDPARIINIGSIDAIQVPMLETYAYSSSKAAVHQLTRHLARQLGRKHITVNAIAPGTVRVEDDGRDAARLRRLDREVVAARSHRPARRHGRRRDLSCRVGPARTSPARSFPVDGGIATTK